MPLAIGSFHRKAWARILSRLAAPRQGALLWVLTIAVEKQLPLVPVLEAFAHDMRGAWRRKTWELAGALDAGISLPDALESVPGIAPPSAVLTTRVGAESGTLGPALRLAAETFTARQEAERSRIRNWLVYLVVLAFIMFVIVSFVMYWIIPKFKKIFEDFGTELPPMTLMLIRVSNMVVSYFVPGFFAILVALLILFVIRTLHPADSASLSLLSRFIPRLRTPEVLRCLSIVVQAGRPIVSGLASLETHLTDISVRRRVHRVHTDVQSGNDVWNSMIYAGLLQPADASVLAAAERVGNLGWALRTMADKVERQLEYRFQLFLEFFRPAALLLFGAVVGVIVVGLFMPLIKLLGDLG